MYLNDKLIGQVCHIEDAMPGGRWNKEKSNEDNRHERNLMLMCYKHHKLTDDVTVYDVPYLKWIKKRHEDNVSSNITPTTLVMSNFEAVNVVSSNFTGGSKTLIENTKNSNFIDINVDGDSNSNPEDFDPNA